MVREEIIKALNVEPGGDSYDCLKYCLFDINGKSKDRDIIDPWFKGVIDSLYYKPNKNVLILTGPPAIGKTHLLKELWYNPYRFKTTSELLVNDLYEYAIIDFQFEKRHLNIPSKDFFKIDTVDSLPISNKRLTSFCGTSNNLHYPQRNNFIVLNLEVIDQEVYNTIDKRKLWIEVYNKFKP